MDKEADDRSVRIWPIDGIIRMELHFVHIWNLRSEIMSQSASLCNNGANLLLVLN